MDFEPGEEGLGGLLSPVEIIPPAMAGQLVLEIAPQALDQVELGRVGWEKERGWNWSAWARHHSRTA